VVAPSNHTVYLEAYRRNIRSVTMRFTVNFTNLLLKARIVVNAPWATPEATALANRTIILRNPNPIPVPAKVRMILINYADHTRRVTVENITLPPSSTQRLTVPAGWSYVAVNVYALAPGGRWTLILAKGYYGG
jgi:hypothetical protein